MTVLLEPVSAGQTRFRMQGLTPDGRGIAVGREALLVFESIDRLVSFLGAYSEEASLDDLLPGVTLERARREGGGSAILLRCAATDGYAIDRLVRLAGATRGRTFVGGGRMYVRARERAAPFGYDLAVQPSEVASQDPDAVVSIDLQFSNAYVAVDRIDPIELIQRLELRPVPLPRGGIAGDPDLCGLRELALVLVAPGVADRVLSYLWRQEVRMAGVRLSLDGDTEPSLLLRLRQPPARVLDVLRAIPGIELFAAVSPRAAVEVGYQHPLHLASANACLPGDEMSLFRGRTGRVEVLDGAPRFVDGRHVVRSDVGARLRDSGAITGHELEPLRVELRLQPTGRAREPRAVLVPWEHAEMLRRLVYVIPPSTLTAARVAPLAEGLLVLSSHGVRGHEGALAVGSSIPLGSRYCEVAPGVLVPDGHELWPRVRTQLIRGLLGLDPDDLAIFLSTDLDPVRVRSEQLSALDAAVVGELSLGEAHVVQTPSSAVGPGRVENRRLGRFALWGYRGGKVVGGSDGRAED